MCQHGRNACGSGSRRGPCCGRVRPATVPRRAAQVPPAARRCDFGSEAGIDYKTTLSTNSGPDEIVHRHRAVMRIAADEMIGTPGVALGIADRTELVFGEMAVHGAVSSVGRVRSEGKDCGGSAAVQA